MPRGQRGSSTEEKDQEQTEETEAATNEEAEARRAEAAERDEKQNEEDNAQASEDVEAGARLREEKRQEDREQALAEGEGGGPSVDDTTVDEAGRTYQDDRIEAGEITQSEAENLEGVAKVLARDRDGNVHQVKQFHTR